MENPGDERSERLIYPGLWVSLLTASLDAQIARKTGSEAAQQGAEDRFDALIKQLGNISNLQAEADARGMSLGEYIIGLFRGKD